MPAKAIYSTPSATLQLCGTKFKSLKGLRAFRRETKGGVAVLFTFAIVPIMLFVGSAVDYQRMMLTRAKMQDGADHAALYTVGAVASYMQKNNAYPSSSAISTMLTQVNALVGAATGGRGSVSASNFHVCTPTNGDCTATVNGSTVTLQSGQVAVRVTGSQGHIFPSLPGFPSLQNNVSLAATSAAGVGATPTKLNYQFQFAKGWYYKVVTLWYVPVASSTPVALASWTYHAWNTSNVAHSVGTIPYFSSSSGDTGTGTVTTWYDSSTVVDSSGTITLPNYTKIYLTMQVENSTCAPGQTASTLTGSNMVNATTAQSTFYTQYYSSMSSTKTNVKCTGTANTSFDLTMSTNSATNSDHIFINGVQQPNNYVIPLTSAFPCPANPLPNQTATNYYEWEDSSNTSSTGNRDYLFSLTTTCSVHNLFGGGPMLLR